MQMPGIKTAERRRIDECCPIIDDRGGECGDEVQDKRRGYRYQRRIPDQD
jgi:hypothetical protein